MSVQLPERIDQLTVLCEGQELGLLTHSSHHSYQPTQTKRHVSLTMTRDSLESYSSGALHPIFAQNLPEGFNRRFIAERLARYARVNDMYLLALQGDAGVGMLSYQSGHEFPEAEVTSLNEILTYTGGTPLFPQLLERYYLRNTLAGVQPKVSVPATSRTIEQKDLIVKSFDPEFPLLTVNEYVCMQAAKHCGLEPPQTYLADNLETFVIERFDRPNGKSLGYEDFTTLMKRPNNPDEKYRGSYEVLLKATRLYTNSQAEVMKMYHYIVFNCLIGNGDAHLKNFALQYTPDMQRIFVSPPFDITHTLMYDTVDNKMALKIGGSKAFPDQKALLKLAKEAQIQEHDAKALIERLADGILTYLTQSDAVDLLDGLKPSITGAVDQVMRMTYTTKGYRENRQKKFD